MSLPPARGARMKSKDRIVAFVVALVVLAALVVVGWLLVERNAALPVPKAPANEAPAPTDPAPASVSSTDVLANEAPAADRSAVPASAPDTARAKPASSPKLVTDVVARLLDESLRPIAGGWLGTSPDFTGFVASNGKDGRARSDADGIVTLHWQGDGTRYAIAFEAGADGCATLFPRGEVKAGETLHLGELVLRPGGAVSGIVLDDGQHPVAKAQVVIANPSETWGANDLEVLRNRGPELYGGVLQTKSGADGRFRVEGAPVGATRAWARADGTRWALSEPIEVPARGEVRDVRLVLDNPAQADRALQEIEGVVLAPDGTPVPKATISVQQSSENTTWSTSRNADGHGRFRIQPQQRGVHIRASFCDPERRFAELTLDELQPGTKDLVVQLTEAKHLVLVVTDESGPLEHFSVSWMGEDHGSHTLEQVERVHEGGRAVVYVPSASFSYTIGSPGHLPQVVGPIDGSRPPAEYAVKLRSIPGIRGRVLDGERPVPGAKLSLHEQPTNTEIEVNGFATLVEPQARAEATSAEDGSFRLDLVSNGTYVVFVDAEGFARLQYGPFELDAERGVRDLALVLDAGGTLEGHVLVASGRSPAGVIVSVNRGDAKPRTQTVGPDGSFRFEHLTAGAWELARAEEMFGGATSTSMSSGDGVKPAELRHDLSIAVGQTTRRDLDLRQSGPGTIEISLVHNGAPARAWSIAARPSGKHTFTTTPPGATTDSNGRAHIEIDAPGPWTLTLRPPPELASTLDITEEVELHAGANEWSHEVRTARLEGLLASWQPGAHVWVRLDPQGAPPRASITISPDDAGRFSLPLVLAGAWEIGRGPSDGSGAWEKLQEFQLAAGESKLLTLP